MIALRHHQGFVALQCRALGAHTCSALGAILVAELEKGCRTVAALSR